MSTITTSQRETSLDVSAITAFMRTIANEHVDGYQQLDSEGLVQSAFYEIECRILVGAAPTAYLIAVGNVERQMQAKQ